MISDWLPEIAQMYPLKIHGPEFPGSDPANLTEIYGKMVWSKNNPFMCGVI